MGKPSRNMLVQFALGLALSATALTGAQCADSMGTKIEGDWVANDYPQQGRKVKFYLQNGKMKFEDFVQGGLRLTGSIEEGVGDADLTLVYEKGFKCRYMVSFRGATDLNNAVLSFGLLSEKKQDNNNPFRCLSGRLEQFR